MKLIDQTSSCFLSLFLFLILSMHFLNMGEKETVQFSIRGPIPVQCSVDGEKVKRIGCSIIDLNFNQQSQFGELVFTNFYTAFISIYLKRQVQSKAVVHKQSSASHNRSIESDEWNGKGRSKKTHLSGVNGGSSRGRNGSVHAIVDVTDRPWECSVYMRTLMKLPHFEDGSQDIYSIIATESLVEWRDVIIMRLVIHQPSSVWKHFTVEDINVFRSLPKRGFSHQSDDITNQRDNWLSVLKHNTKRMLNGCLVEPEQEKQDIRKGPM